MIVGLEYGYAGRPRRETIHDDFEAIGVSVFTDAGGGTIATLRVTIDERGIIVHRGSVVSPENTLLRLPLTPAPFAERA